jgi:hypothetical protein
MDRRALSIHWTEKDRLTWSKWARAVAVFYGCATVFLFALIVLNRVLGSAPNELRDLQTRSAVLQGEPVDTSGKRESLSPSAMLKLRQ